MRRRRLRKGEIGLLAEFHGTVDYYVTNSKQLCYNFCTFMRKLFSQLNSLCQFINVKGIFYAYFVIIHSSLRNTEEMCFIHLVHYVVIPNLDTYFVNIFSSVSSYCLYLLSPVLILCTLSQKVTDVPLITNVED